MAGQEHNAPTRSGRRARRRARPHRPGQTQAQGPRTSTRCSTRSTTCSRSTPRSSSAGSCRRAASDRRPDCKSASTVADFAFASSPGLRPLPSSSPRTPPSCCPAGAAAARGSPTSGAARHHDRGARPSRAAWSWPVTAGRPWATSSPSVTSRRCSRPTSTRAVGIAGTAGHRGRDGPARSRSSSSTTRRSRARRCPWTARRTGWPR